MKQKSTKLTAIHYLTVAIEAAEHALDRAMFRSTADELRAEIAGLNKKLRELENHQ
jgi:hypothetical protein